jgi:hypothetical protein
MSIYTVGSRPAFANATFLSGMIVNWDYDLTMIGDYQLTLKTNPGNLNRSITLRGIDFGGSTYEPDKVCIVGACGMDSGQYQVDSFIQCFDREFVSGVETLSFAWNKIITLNLWNTGSTVASENPGWEHVQMDDTYIYAATRGKFMFYDIETPMYATIAKFRISDGNIMWIKKFTIGTSNTTTGKAKGITSLALRPDALYASLSVGDPVQPSVQYKGAGYDYIKIDPNSGLTNEGCSLLSQATMQNTNTVGGYIIYPSSNYTLTSTYSSGSSNVTTVSQTLEATNLNSTVSNQWGINPEYVKYPLPPFDSSANVSQSAVCTASLNQVYYYQGTASTLSQGDSVFSDIKGCSPLSNGYYKIDSVNNLYMIVSSGIATSIANTCTLVPFLAGAGTTGNACFTTGSSFTYYHNGTGTYPTTGNIVYTTNSTSNPLNGGGGTNYAIFASGPPQPPVSYFRVTGSTGTVQQTGSCP